MIVIVMGRATAIYIREDDQELWERVVAYARTRRMPVSGLVMLALERFLAEEEHEDDDR